jgi:hypothetical protein
MLLILSAPRSGSQLWGVLFLAALIAAALRFLVMRGKLPALTALAIAMVANAMATSTQGTNPDSHWTERAGALLSCLLHAAAISGRSMRDLANWVNRHELDTPLGELPEHSPAHGLLYGIKRTDPENQTRYLSNASGVLKACRSEAALRIADDPNFDPDAFVRSTDTLDLVAPAERQRLMAPLVVGLLMEIRQASYRAHREDRRGAPLMALDEARNVAPIPDLPQQLSDPSEGEARASKRWSSCSRSSRQRRLERRGRRAARLRRGHPGHERRL